ncbi:unnamed protein product [Hermetia illucens]|uniref:RRM domain-containing protein n=1 Tax=Hermetia illucens TaxID=343691 RepID=A0A7R8UII2_HERIL|nr:unnamed protein product [Hermetia illucens]
MFPNSGSSGWTPRNGSRPMQGRNQAFATSGNFIRTSYPRSYRASVYPSSSRTLISVETNAVRRTPVTPNQVVPYVDTPDTTLKRSIESDDVVVIPEESISPQLPNDTGLKPRVSLQPNCTVEIRKIPREFNSIAVLNSHFSKYGKIVNIQIAYEADPEAATVTYSNPAQANEAYRNTEAFLRHRTWFKPETPVNSTVSTYKNSMVSTYKAPAAVSSFKRKRYFTMAPKTNTRLKFCRKDQEQIEDLQKRKHALLEGYLKQLKAVQDIMAKSNPSDPSYQEKVNIVKRLESCIETTREEIALDEVQKATEMQFQLPVKAPEETRELSSSSSEGVATDIVDRPSSRSEGAPADDEQTTILVSGFDREDSGSLLKHFQFYGKIMKHDMDSYRFQLKLTYATPHSAKKALEWGQHYKEKKLEINWATTVAEDADLDFYDDDILDYEEDDD